MVVTFGREEYCWAVVMNPLINKGTPIVSRLCNTFFLVGLVWLTFACDAIEGREGEICVVKTPLNSPYFIPYIETPNACNGCSYRTNNVGATADESAAVHVIQMEKVVDNVLQLRINNPSSSLNESKDFIFVITSSELIPISIVIHTELSNVTFKFLTRPEDFLFFYGSSSEHSVSSRMWRTPEEALEGTEKEFGFISSFTRAKHVNKIVFDLSKQDLKTEDCSIHTDKETSVSECSLIVRKETSGCFHEHMLGYGNSDIHIIEIDSKFDNASDRRITLHVTDAENETLRSQMSAPVKRNLTFVLRSTYPTLWTLKVSNVQGHIFLFVADDGQVDNKSCAGISVSVKRLELPKTFDQTILHVLASIGPLVSYTRTEAPSIIQLVVPGKKKPKTTKMESNAASADVIHNENAQNLLTKFLNYECFAGEMTLTLPLWAEKRTGGVTITLRDQACRSFSNSTHLVLRSKFSQCGFMQEEYKNYFLYTNIANLEFGSRQLSLSDDEDFEGSGFQSNIYERKVTKIIKCKSNQKMQHKTNMDMHEKHLEYSLQVYRDENLLKRIWNFPAIVPSDSTIYAKVEFVKGLSKYTGLKILIEQCILSSSPHYVTTPVTLIRKSCSHQPYVTVKKSFINTNLVFYFLLSLETVPARRVFLHCQIGLCSNDPLPQLNLKKCVDPESYCAKDSLLKAFDTQMAASLIDSVVVGPFEVESVKEGVMLPPNFGTVPSTHEKLGSGQRNSQIVVMEGLSTEVVVGIAIASFIIGVCLTATLWIIYLKTDPQRQSRPESVMPRNSGYDLSGHSGSSTPSSQAPMTT